MADDKLHQILDGSRSMSMLDLRHVLSDQNRPNVDGKTTILSVACSQAFVNDRLSCAQRAGNFFSYVFFASLLHFLGNFFLFRARFGSCPGFPWVTQGDSPLDFLRGLEEMLRYV